MIGFVLFLFALVVIFHKVGPKRERPDAELRLVVTPLLRRTTRDWQRIEDVTRGLQHPYLKLFWGQKLGWIQVRRLPWRRGEWVRLTALGERNTSANSN